MAPGGFGGYYYPSGGHPPPSGAAGGVAPPAAGALSLPLPPEQLLQRAMDAWRYHTRPILRQEGDDLIVEDPPLLLFYHHRIVTHAERLATSEPERDAAIEMARMWRLQS